MERSDQTAMRLVLLDDHVAARRRLAAQLARIPEVTVVAALTECSDAHEMVEASRPDAVLVETRRVDERGLEAIATLSALPRQIRPAVVAYLEIVHRGDWADARVAGADDVLLKELTPAALVGELRRIVDRVRQHAEGA